jgi:hypothetical protein
MRQVIIGLLCFVLIKMVALLVMGACNPGVLLNILNRVSFTLFLLLCKACPQYSSYCYVRPVSSIHLVAM